MTVIINGTNGITSVNGTAAAPSVTGTDTDTGIVYGTNTLSLATGGTTAATIDSSQNVLVGMGSYGVTNAGVSLSPTASSSFYVAGGTAVTIGRGTSDGTAVQFNRSGTNVGTLGVATTGISMTGVNGITFTGTQTASADVNTLDDYEEGTWTPSLEGLSTAGTAGYSERGGRYIKIGTMVYIVFHIQLSSFSGAAGELIIRGIPFNSGAMGSATVRNSFPMCRWSGLSSGASNVVAMTADNTNYLGVAVLTSFVTGSPYYSTVSAVTGSTILTGSGCYYTAN